MNLTRKMESIFCRVSLEFWDSFRYIKSYGRGSVALTREGALALDQTDRKQPSEQLLVAESVRTERKEVNDLVRNPSEASESPKV